MAFPTKLNQLCTPSYVYFIISVLSIVVSAFQNMGSNGLYRLGIFSCRVPSCLMVFMFKVIYILFWTWVLNLMCKDGHREIAWFLVLLPFIMLFIVMGAVMMYQQRQDKKEGMNGCGKNCAGCPYNN